MPIVDLINSGAEANVISFALLEPMPLLQPGGGGETSFGTGEEVVVVRALVGYQQGEHVLNHCGFHCVADSLVRYGYSNPTMKRKAVHTCPSKMGLALLMRPFDDDSSEEHRRSKIPNRGIWTNW